MTNGERIQTILDVDRDCTEVHGENGTMTFTVTQDFWNAEYKEPTTKNDCETCIHNKGVLECDMYGCKYEPTIKNEAKYCDRNICLKNEYNNVGCEDCEVTKSQEPTTKNNLGVDCISRAAARSLICKIDLKHPTFGMSRKVFKDLYNGIDELPSVTPSIHNSSERIDKCIDKDLAVDCISRQEAIDTIRQLYLDLATQKAVIDLLKILPSVTPQKPEIVPIAEIKYDEDKLKELVNKAVLSVTPQEPVIDKIRFEIEAYAIHATDEKQRIAFNSCLNLIDHYTELKPN